LHVALEWLRAHLEIEARQESANAHDVGEAVEVAGVGVVSTAMRVGRIAADETEKAVPE
jgi:hypothetical protein